MGILQKKIDEISKYGILELEYGEYYEQIVINKPITFKSNNLPITIASDKSPCLRINSDSVILQNLIIQSSTNSGISISVKEKANPIFNDVYVYGNVEGIIGEEGEWDIPKTVELVFSNLNYNENEIIIYAPNCAKVYIKDNELVKIKNDSIHKGINKIVLEIGEVFPNNIINGDIIIESKSTGLKRRIAFNGNTFSNNVIKNAKKIIWECKKSKAKINEDLLKKIKLAYEGEIYEIRWLLKELNCIDNMITVKGLPDGLKSSFNENELKIYGIPQKKGDYNLRFFFERDGEKTIIESRFIVKPKKILPLIIEEFPNKIKLLENSRYNQKIKIISSNSLNVKFKFSKSDSNELHINENTGEIFGEFKKHGFYNFTINISDGINSINKDISFTIIPWDELKIINNSIMNIYKGEYFESEIIVDNSEGILYQLSSPYTIPKGVNLVKKDEKYFISGKIDKIGIHKIILIIEDVYTRSITQEMTLECIEKPKYIMKWLTDEQIDVTGIKDSEFNTKIKATLDGLPLENIDYKLKGNYGHNIQLGKKGDLKIFIRSTDFFSITVIASCKFGEFEKQFNVSINVRSKSVLSIEKEKVISKLFENETIKNDLEEFESQGNKISPKIKTQLFLPANTAERNGKKNENNLDINCKKVKNEGRDKEESKNTILSDLFNLSNNKKKDQ